MRKTITITLILALVLFLGMFVSSQVKDGYCQDCYDVGRPCASANDCPSGCYCTGSKCAPY